MKYLYFILYSTFNYKFILERGNVIRNGTLSGNVLTDDLNSNEHVGLIRIELFSPASDDMCVVLKYMD